MNYFNILLQSTHRSCESCLCLSGFPTKILYAPLLSSIHAPSISFFWFNHPNNTRIWWKL